jgi:leader peptidase (prepilin peptidase)/N-methyltransferase
VIGACIGSFLNVCIYRMPKDLSIVRPRSRCPACEHPIAWYDNIPLFSFALLRARCRHCPAPIRWRYPMVEALTGALTAAVVWRFGAWPVGLVYLAFVWSLIVVSFIDFDYKIIPNVISIGGLLVGLIVSPLVPQLHGTQDAVLAAVRSVFGAMVGCSILYLTGSIGTFIFQKEAMGLGDVDLLAMAGAFLGWKAVVLTFFLAPMLAMVPGVLVLLRKQSHEIPYGPYLSMGLVVSMFAGDRVIAASGIEQTVQTLIMAFGWAR